MATLQDIPPLPLGVPIVDPKTGAASIAFATWWEKLFGNVDDVNEDVDGKADASTEIIAGTGLTGGGDLSANRTLDLALTLAITIAQSGVPAATSVGFLGSPQIADNDDYTLALTDSGGHYYHTSATPHTLTIPANASVAFPIGTVLAIVNENGAGAITLAITSDTLRWGSSTGARTIAANGVASLLKVAPTVWRLTGEGIT